MKQIFLLTLILTPHLLSAQSQKDGDSSANVIRLIPGKFFRNVTPGPISMRFLSTFCTTETEPLIVINNYLYDSTLADLKLNPSEIKSIIILNDFMSNVIFCNNRTRGAIVIETIKKDSAAKKLTQIRNIDTTTVTHAPSIIINPNPATDRFRVNVKNNTGPCNLSLVNMQGQIVKAWTNVNTLGKQYEFDITGIPPGNYIATMKTKSGISSGKILVTR